ncbi:DUF4082 domain-containing protein, partial [Rhizobium johnstonii]|uniref:DUF4082 domain-containing protein n=1 Tax=Rhizobium johnstonii TaxID=3019933 RepID=UPI003F9913C3
MRDRASTSRRRKRRMITAITGAAMIGLAVAVAAVAIPLTAVSSAAAVSIFGDNPPESYVDADRNSVELGVTFRTKVPGEILGVRYWKTAENKGPHVGNLWSSS